MEIIWLGCTAIWIIAPLFALFSTIAAQNNDTSSYDFIINQHPRHRK